MVKSAKEEVRIANGGVELAGSLEVPDKAIGIVVFAHGSGSSRNSPRNQYVADELQKGGFATLLFDLLTEEEDRTYATRFDIGLLTHRLVDAVKWLDTRKEAAFLPVGLFGASTGAAAAMCAAAELGSKVCAVVSRGGRPDLAIADLPKVTQPSLFIVGGDDPQVLQLNEEALRAMPEATVSRLEIVEGATHLFEEPGTLQQVAKLATEWFLEHASKHRPDWEEC